MKIKFLLIIIVVVALITGGVFLYNNSLNISEEPVPTKNTSEDEDLDNEEVQVSKDLAIGNAAPNFTLKDLAGEDVSLIDYKGKIVLLNFWATWCVYCDIEMPDLNLVHKENDDVVVLAVDVMEEKSIVEEYINKGGYEFDVVLDEDGEIARTYLVSGFPTSYFIDKDGILLGGVPGMLTLEQMNGILDGIREDK